MQLKANWLVIADGEPLGWGLLLPLAKERKVMVLDGAYTEDLAQYLEPELIVGDLDSIDASLKEKLADESPSRLLQDKDQNSTDLDKGLRFLMKQQAQSVVICNATGLRMDHTLYNLGLLKRYHHAFASLMIVTAYEKIVYLENQSISLKGQVKEPLAILSFPKALVHSQGLAYECDHLNLEVGSEESVSNALAAPKALLQVQGSALLMLSHTTELEMKQ